MGEVQTSPADYRVVLAGFGEEHDELLGLGWRKVEWFTAGFLQGGYGQLGKNGHQQHRERLWLSPACLTPKVDDDRQLRLW